MPFPQAVAVAAETAILAVTVAMSAEDLAKGGMIMGNENHDASRRTILKGSALGAGALLGAAGLQGSAHAAAAAKPDLPPGSVPGPDNYFIKLDGTSIGVTDFSFGASRAATDGTTTAKEAKPAPFTFTAPSSVFTPTLLSHCVAGTHIKQAQLYVRDIKSQALYIKIDLHEVLVSSYHLSGPSDDSPGDSFTLNFTKIEMSYYPYDAATGTLGTPNTASWDLKSNKIA
jgi:type VI secretion system secreted protein Hcp